MSAGAFVRSKYLADSGSVHPIRIQPETLDLTLGGTANTAPAGALSTGVPSAKVSGTSRSIGVNARRVRIQFTATPPTGYKAGGTITLPWLNSATFGAISPNSTGTYLGAACIVLGKRGEILK